VDLSELRHIVGRARNRLIRRDRDQAAIFASRYEYWLAQLHKVQWQLQYWRNVDASLANNLDYLHENAERQLKPLENDLRLLKQEYDRFDGEAVGQDPLTGRSIVTRYGDEAQWSDWERRNAEQNERISEIRFQMLRREGPLLRRHYTVERMIAALEEQRRTQCGFLESARRRYYEMGGNPDRLPK
jgi:hypothetical protein